MRYLLAILFLCTGTLRAELVPATLHRVASPATLTPVNTRDRWEVKDFYKLNFTPDDPSGIQWTGSYETGAPGTTSAAFRLSELRRINFYRIMAGVPSVLQDEGFSDLAQAAALLMAANNDLSHSPPNTWKFWTTKAAAGAGRSNLVLGAHGVGAIDAYIDDQGENNAKAGHRNWLLSNGISVVGLGDVPAKEGVFPANAVLVVDDGSHPNPHSDPRDGFIAWPPRGFAPAKQIYNRWSFLVPTIRTTSGNLRLADCSQASVTASCNGVPIDTQIESRDGQIVFNLKTGGMPLFAGRYLDKPIEITVTNYLLNGAPTQFTYTVTPFDPEAVPATFLTQPVSPNVVSSTVNMTAVADGARGYQWTFDGVPLAGKTSPTLNLDGVSTESAGLYQAIATTDRGDWGSAISILGMSTTAKLTGKGEIVGNDVLHPNGRVFDQILLNGKSEAITADNDQVTRTSFIDLNDDIVQVEFSGPGTLTLVLDQVSPPATPAKYNQPTVKYVKGHARIIITGANEHTNVSVFTVGRATAFDPTGAFSIIKAVDSSNDPAKNGSPLFKGHESTQYDGVADIAYIAIRSTNGKFGGIRTANASYFATRGLTGIHAPNVTFTGPVYLGDINAFGSAEPRIIVGSVADCRVTGGSMEQDNGFPITIEGISTIKFTPGADASGRSLPAQSNKGVFRRSGVNVTHSTVQY